MSDSESKTAEYVKMISGQYYYPGDEYLVDLRLKAHTLCDKFNKTAEANVKERNKILAELLKGHGKNILIEKSFKADYGCNLSVGDNFYANFDFLVLDIAPITIGNNAMLGPGVHIYSVNHPIEAKERLELKEIGKPVTIGDNVWIGGKSVICPGVTLGNNVVVAAGSVVTKSFGDDVIIGGNPAKVIRAINNSAMKE